MAPFWAFISTHHLSQPLCVCNGKVFEMYRNILSEVIALFPSEFIHVGGDEVPKDAWECVSALPVIHESQRPEKCQPAAKLFYEAH